MDIPSLLSIAKRAAYRLDMDEDSIEQWCVAGGAVRDALIGADPKDIDMYALGIPDSPFGPVQRISLYSGEDVFNGTSDELVMEIQLMHTRCKTAQELISTFDWNICQCALLPNGQILGANVGEMVEYRGQLRLVNITNPFSNLRRGYRFSERYGLDIPTTHLIELFKACLRKANGGEISISRAYGLPLPTVDYTSCGATFDIYPALRSIEQAEMADRSTRDRYERR